jgi:hypothetical protein
MAAQAGYEQFQGIRKELVGIVGQLRDVVAAIGQESLVSTTTELRDRVASETFRVLIAGEFNAGKSTTVNAMLGDEVLPAAATPTTAVLCVVRWGEPKRALLYRADATSRSSLDPAPQEIKVTELGHYVTVGASSGGPNKWGLAEICWPLEFCRPGVEIIDSPGLNDSPEHSRITLDYVNRADAVVFVFSALQALTEAERKVVDQQLKIFSHDNMFCLVNRINQVGDEDDVADVTADARARMKEYWALGENRVFFVDAKGALKGRQNRQPERVANSGLPVFEQSLEQFLTTDRARVKIVPSAIQAQEISADARIHIDSVFTLLDKNIEALTAAYESQAGPLDRLRQERELIGRSIETHLIGTRIQVEEAARRMLLKAASSCPEWARAIDRVHKVTLRPFKARAQAEAAVQEISDGLSDQILQYAEDWQQGELADIIAQRSSDLDDQVGEKLIAFARNLDEIRTAILNAGGAGDDFLASPGSRGAAIAGGILLNPGALLIGAQFGFKEMLKELIPQLGLAVGLALLGFGPGFLITALFGMGAIRALFKLTKLNEKIVASVAASVSQKLRDEATDITRAIAGEIYAELDEQRVEVDRKLAAPVAALHEAVQFALHERDRTKESNTEVKARLMVSHQELDEIDRRAGAIVKDWAMGYPASGR